MYLSAYSGYNEVLSYLVSCKADVNFSNNDQKTPLFIACTKNNLAGVKILLEAKANPNIGNLREYTPLMESAQNGNLELVRLLIAAKANLDSQELEGWTALICATDNGVIRELLLAKANPNISNKHGQTALMKAADQNRIDDINFLLAMKADPALKDNSNLSAISFALRMENHRAAGILFQAGLGISEANEAHFVLTQLYLANISERYKVKISIKKERKGKSEEKKRG